MPCMCGADDCPRCFPGNFSRIGSKQVYTAEMSDEEFADALQGAAENEQTLFIDDQDFDEGDV